MSAEKLGNVKNNNDRNKKLHTVYFPLLTIIEKSFKFRADYTKVESIPNISNRL